MEVRSEGPPERSLLGQELLDVSQGDGPRPGWDLHPGGDGVRKGRGRSVRDEGVRVER